MKWCLESAGIVKIRTEIADLVEDTHEGVRFAVTKFRTPVAGLVNFADLRALEALTKLSPADLARIQVLVGREKRIAIGILIGWLDSLDLDDIFDDED